MVARVLGLHCQEDAIDFGDGIPALVMRAEHEHCPGGHTMPGVLGGWQCSCPCHTAAEAHPLLGQQGGQQ